MTSETYISTTFCTMFSPVNSEHITVLAFATLNFPVCHLEQLLLTSVVNSCHLGVTVCDHGK